MAPIRRDKLPKKNKRYRGIIFRYHGNYVGPGWSAGKYQASVANSKVLPIDEFDRTAMEHDRAYALGKNLKKADYKFFKENWGKGWKRSAAAAAVGFQGYLRPVDSSSSNTPEMASRSRSRGRKMSISPVRRGKRPAATTPAKLNSKLRRLQRQLKASPRYGMKGSEPGMVKFLRRRGASQSKSAGFFKKPRGGLSVLDSYAKKGIVHAIERGGVLEGTLVNPQHEAVIIGHSNFTPDTICIMVGYSMAKLVANKMKIHVERETDVLKLTGTGTIQLSLRYKNFPTDVEQTHTFNITPTTSFQLLARDFYDRAKLASQNTTWIRLNCTDNNGTATAATTLFSIDLSHAKINLYCKSALKVQNRTVNASGNVDSDDVDNVPIYGKSYTGYGNFATHRTGQGSMDYLAPADVEAFPSPIFGATINMIKSCVIKKQIAGGGWGSGSPLVEPMGKSQFAHVRGVTKAKLEPGEIKTNILVYSKSCNLNKLWDFAESDVSADSITNLGKFWFAHFEKMLQAVATTQVNAIKVAYELDQKLGAYVTAPQVVSTNYIIDNAPISPTV